MDGWTMRESRRASGLTAKQVARATGTSETNVAAYERGDKVPNGTTRSRMEAATSAGAASPVFVHNLLTVPSAAAAIRKGLRQGWRTSDLLRVIRESRSNAKWVEDRKDLAVFFSPPSTTGDRRWDALIAGSTEDLSFKYERSAPEWTVGHVLQTFWFVGSNRAYDAYALAHSPASLKIRGVMMDPSDLDSV